MKSPYLSSEGRVDGTRGPRPREPLLEEAVVMRAAVEGGIDQADGAGELGERPAPRQCPAAEDGVTEGQHRVHRHAGQLTSRDPQGPKPARGESGGAEIDVEPEGEDLTGQHRDLEGRI